MREIFLLLYKKNVSASKKTKYIGKFGSIMYAIIETHIAIVFSTSMVSRFSKNLGSEHFSTVNQILRYLAVSQDREIIFEREPKLKLVGYSDSNWAKDHANRKSTLGFVFTY